MLQLGLQLHASVQDMHTHRVLLVLQFHSCAELGGT